MWLATIEVRRPSSSSIKAISLSMSIGAPKWKAHVAHVAMLKPKAALPKSSLTSANRPIVNWALPELHFLLRRPSNSAIAGSLIAWLKPAVPVPPHSDGPTRTPTQKPSASVRLLKPAAMCRSASCVLRLLNRRLLNQFPAGFADSVWPSRSSSVTHAVFSKNSPAFPKALSTSFLSILFPLRSLRSPQRAPSPNLRLFRLPLVRRTRCTTAAWSTLSARGSSSVRCTTPRVSPSSCRPGRFPAAAESRANSNERPKLLGVPKASSARSPCAANKPSGAQQLKKSAKKPNGPLAMSRSTAHTPNAKPSMASTACWHFGTTRPQKISATSASILASSSGMSSLMKFTFHRSSRQHAFAPHRAERLARPVPIDFAARSSPPNDNLLHSTLRTHSSLRTLLPVTRFWQRDACPPINAFALSAR